MNNDLEKYLKENRLKLDTDEPNEDLIWRGIEGGINKKDNLLPHWFWKVAAIFLFVVSASYLIINETKEETNTLFSLADISEDLGKQEAELQQLVSLKWEEVKPFIADESSNIQFLIDELNELGHVYESYQEDLKNTGANEQIINALLDYYTKKIRILSRISHEIQKQKSHEKTI